jgi:hypothetical protein
MPDVGSTGDPHFAAPQSPAGHPQDRASADHFENPCRRLRKLTLAAGRRMEHLPSPRAILTRAQNPRRPPVADRT